MENDFWMGKVEVYVKYSPLYSEEDVDNDAPPVVKVVPELDARCSQTAPAPLDGLASEGLTNVAAGTIAAETSTKAVPG